MNDPEIGKRIESTLERLGRRVEDLDRDDVEVEIVPGKVDIEMPDGKRLILSRQSATNQIWLAEPGGGWRFDLHGEQWLCDKRGVELHANLQALLSAHCGTPISLV